MKRLFIIERSASSSTPISSKEDGRVQKNLHLDLAPQEVALANEKACLSPLLLLRPSSDRGWQTGHWETNCLKFCKSKVKSSPKCWLHGSLSYLLGPCRPTSGKHMEQITDMFPTQGAGAARTTCSINTCWIMKSISVKRSTHKTKFIYTLPSFQSGFPQI